MANTLYHGVSLSARYGHFTNECADPPDTPGIHGSNRKGAARQEMGKRGWSL